jgi:response regulator RpfG family c-di-GMP phosphodiesterase
MPTTLIVDDEAPVRELMARWLGARGYEARTAADALEALTAMADEPPDVAVCDVRLPGLDGVWLAGQIRSYHPETAVIMATGLQDVDPAIASLRVGVVDYLVKPFSPEHLARSVTRGLEWHRSAVERRERRARLAQEVRDRRRLLGDVLGRAEIHSRSGVDDLLLSLVDRAGYEHAHRVAALSLSLALTVDMPPEDHASLDGAALLHEIDAVLLPEGVRHDPAALTSDTPDLVGEALHAALHLLGSVPYLAGCAPLIVARHEWFDGSGYPDGLEGGVIPLGSRILALAEQYDALTRPASGERLTRAKALVELDAARGRRFDPAIVDALVILTSIN